MEHVELARDVLTPWPRPGFVRDGPFERPTNLEGLPRRAAPGAWRTESAAAGLDWASRARARSSTTWA